MKPKNLKCPFTWKERKILIHDRVFYVPDYLKDYGSFLFPPFNHCDIFGNDHPVHIEYCSGNGKWIAEKASAEKGINWIAVEKKFERVQKIWSKIKNLNLENLFVVCAEGYQVTKNYFPNSSVEKVYINFPDPWPKKRHEKHRIVHVSFISEIHRILKTEGVLTMATDDAAYSRIMRETLFANKGFSPLHPAPYYVSRLEGYGDGASYFEDLWRGKGKQICYHQYRKQEEK